MSAGLLNPIPDLLDALHTGLIDDDGGELPTYIPELARADRGWFGIALATLDGHVYGSGEAVRPFTVQSVSKPFVYALALADRGLDEMLDRIGVEPSGDAFNTIRLAPGTGRPPNPMVNSGAILTTSLIAGRDTAARVETVRAGLSAFAGRELTINERVYASEAATGDRNRAIAYLMRTAGSLRADVEETLTAYFRQCAIEVTAHDLAVMAATLANRGVNPVTERPVVDADTASHVLTVMATCGMYDFAGEWLLRVGLPAKSGVSGGIAAALPTQFGIGLFSPLLDERGNSVRGIAACEELSARFGLHLMRPPDRVTPVGGLSGTGRTLRSSAERSVAESTLLTRGGSAIAVRELVGDIGFATAERLTRDLCDTVDGLSWVVLDLDRVGRIHPVATRLLDLLTVRLAEHGVTVVVADSAGRGLLPAPDHQFATRDEALRWCEEGLLRQAGSVADTPSQ